jgi:C-terminal region of peptidase_M24
MLGKEELDWVNDYHALVHREVRAELDDATGKWLDEATAPLQR